MPRWKALPEELDPRTREFTEQLRRLVDHGGFGLFALADRTGYDKPSWDRYLGARLLAPKGAVLALAEATGTDPAPLVLLWERAEHAWKRSQTRPDTESGPSARTTPDAGPPPPGTRAAGQPYGTEAAGPPRETQAAGQPYGAQVAGPPYGTEAAGPPRGTQAAGQPYGTEAAGQPYGAQVAGPPYGTEAAGPPRGTQAAGLPYGAEAAGPPHETRAAGPPHEAQAPGPPPGSRGAWRGRPVMFLAGMVAALVVIGAVFLATGGNGRGSTGALGPSAASASAHSRLPPGVGCAGAGCTGKDPEAMGCGGASARSTGSALVGPALVEVRYSRTCGAVWARISRAVRGDRVEVSAGGSGRESGTVDEAADTDAYTPMLSVRDPAAARACATLVSGRTGCTR
ncbi:DUF2690 domain-containing protein [Streptomyces sp. NPDC096198]|uniref:helix-turn-helix domain-containing protein n=1 Tax=Streptomyces sp. NPDC096198 TaxID=3366080 RepID=UPI0037F5BC77